jgi:hypothetical protein
MEIAGSFETFVLIYQTTRHPILGDFNLEVRRHYVHAERSDSWSWSVFNYVESFQRNFVERTVDTFCSIQFLPSRMVTLWTRIREMLGWNPGWAMCYPDREFSSVSWVSPGQFRDNTAIRTLPFPSIICHLNPLLDNARNTHAANNTAAVFSLCPRSWHMRSDVAP